MLSHFNVSTQIVLYGPRATMFWRRFSARLGLVLLPPHLRYTSISAAWQQWTFVRCTENGYISRRSLPSIPSTNNLFGAKTTCYCICRISVKNICVYPVKHNKMSLCVLPPTRMGRVKVIRHPLLHGILTSCSYVMEGCRGSPSSTLTS